MDPSRTSNPLLWLPDMEPGVFLQVKNVLYRVDQIAVQRSSVFLRDLFKFPKASEGSTDGAAEDLPIILDQDTRAFDGDSRAFDIFLLQAHGKHIVLAKDLELHQSILELSRYLRSDSLKALALASIEALRIPSASSAITMIDICFQHGTRIFFADAFDELTRARWSDYTYEQTSLLPRHVFDRLVRLREALQAHDAMVALESPKIDGNHHGNCTDNKGCAADWHQLWWNSVGTSLLNGRQLLSWVTTVDTLMKCDFGRMNTACFAFMTSNLQAYDGYAARFDLVRDVTDELIVTIDEDASFEDEH
ncbi:hypothetical protein C8J56DRAFT_970618 [Mycena floridula]|nr:hypothetical protein C8J56DRAFT_975021 [Mycena floridula]KAJ7577789.1 hypothetical protein C8J56DRAFT_970618 [Mycena floridula]